MIIPDNRGRSSARETIRILELIGEAIITGLNGAVHKVTDRLDIGRERDTIVADSRLTRAVYNKIGCRIVYRHSYDVTWCRHIWRIKTDTADLKRIIAGSITKRDAGKGRGNKTQKEEHLRRGTFPQPPSTRQFFHGLRTHGINCPDTY